MLLEACPSFQAVYDKADDHDLPYIIAGEFARHLLALYKNNNTTEFTDVAALIEKLHIDGDSYVQEFATIGILEGIQNVWGNNGVQAQDFSSYLLPVSQKYWDSLNDFWDGKVPYVGSDVEDT